MSNPIRDARALHEARLAETREEAELLSFRIGAEAEDVAPETVLEIVAAAHWSIEDFEKRADHHRRGAELHQLAAQETKRKERVSTLAGQRGKLWEDYEADRVRRKTKFDEEYGRLTVELEAARRSAEEARVASCELDNFFGLAGLRRDVQRAKAELDRATKDLERGETNLAKFEKSIKRGDSTDERGLERTRGEVQRFRNAVTTAKSALDVSRKAFFQQQQITAAQSVGQVPPTSVELETMWKKSGGKAKRTRTKKE